MSAKYAAGQKVKIIDAKDQNLRSKYPKLKRHLSKTGVILESSFFSTAQTQNLPFLPAPSIYYSYTVRLDKDSSELKAVPEDALEACE